MEPHHSDTPSPPNSGGGYVPPKRKTFKRVLNRIRGRTLANAEPGSFLVAKDKVLAMEHELERTLNMMKSNQALIKHMYAELFKGNTSGEAKFQLVFTAQANLCAKHVERCQTLAVDPVQRKLALVQEIKRKCKDELDFAHLQLEDVKGKIASESQSQVKLAKNRDKLARYQAAYDELSNSIFAVLDQIVEDSGNGTALGFVREECAYFQAMQMELFQGLAQVTAAGFEKSCATNELEEDLWEEFRLRCCARHAPVGFKSLAQSSSAAIVPTKQQQRSSPSLVTSDKPQQPQQQQQQSQYGAKTTTEEEERLESSLQQSSFASVSSTGSGTSVSNGHCAPAATDCQPRFELKKRSQGTLMAAASAHPAEQYGESANKVFAFSNKKKEEVKRASAAAVEPQPASALLLGTVEYDAFDEMSFEEPPEVPMMEISQVVEQQQEQPVLIIQEELLPEAALEEVMSIVEEEELAVLEEVEEIDTSLLDAAAAATVTVAVVGACSSPPPAILPSTASVPCNQPVIAICDFAGEQAGDLAFFTGEELVLLRPAEHASWYVAENTKTRAQGLVPFDGFLKRKAPPMPKTRPQVQSLASSPSPKFRAAFDFVKEEDGDLALRVGDVVQMIGPGPTNEWFLGKHLGTGQQGFVPKAYVTPDSGAANPPVPPPPPARRLVVIETFVAREDGDLTVHKKQIVYQVSTVSKDWTLVRNERGEEGLVPSTFVREDV